VNNHCQNSIHSIGPPQFPAISRRDAIISESHLHQLIKKVVKLRISLIFLAFFLYSFQLQAAQNIRLEQLSLDEGLSQAEVRSILQDHDGYLWLGTQQGLNLYDGHRVRTISGPDNLLEIQQIDFIFQDSATNLWVGSVPNRNFRIQKSDNQIIEISPPFPAGREIQDSAFFEATEDDQGVIWLATMRALFKFTPETQQLTFVIDFEPTLSQRELIRELFVFGDWILVATSNGLYAVNRHTPAIKAVPFVDHLPSELPSQTTEATNDRINVKGIFRNQASNILLATVEGLYELESKSLLTYLSQNSESLRLQTLEPELNIWQLIEEDNFYWLATNEGLIKLNKNGHKEHIFAYSETPYRSADNNIIAMIKDFEGNLWLGSRNDGAFKWTPNLGKFTYYQQTPDDQKALSNNRVWSTREDNQGNIWVGTRNGLNRIDKQSGEVKQFLVNPDKKATVSGSTFFDLEIQGDKIWMATVEGIRHFNITNQQEDTPLLTPEAQKIFAEPPIDIFILDDSNIGIIRQDGVYNYNTQSGEISYNENSRNDGKIQQRLLRVATADPHNSDRLIMTMVDQVVSYSKSMGTYQVLHALPPADAPRTVAQDVYINDKHTWIAYPGFGIYIIDNETGKEIKHITSVDGLPDNSPLQFEADPQGNIWVTSNSGLIRFDKDTFHFRVYDTNDGLSTNEFNGGASMLSSDGEFYFGSIKGIMKVNPASLTPTGNQRTLHNHITNISLMSRELPESFSPIIDSSLDIGHQDYGLKLEFSALSFTSPKKLKYKYWLEGSSKTTPAITSDSELFLPKLEPGNSVFNVSVIDYETGKESPPEKLYINVSPHPAFSWWAYSLYILFVLTVGFTIFWQRHKRQIALLKAHSILKTNEERLHLALTSADGGLWDWQAKDNRVFESRQEDSDFHKGDYFEFQERLKIIHKDERERYQKAWNSFIAGESDVFDQIYRWKKDSGEWAWYRDLARVTEVDEEGQPTRATGTYTDITQSKDDRDKIILFSEAFQNTRDVVAITDDHLIVNAANTALYRTTDLTDDKVISHPLSFILAPDKDAPLIESIEDELKSLGHWEGEARLQRRYQQPLPVLVSINSFVNELGQRRFVFALTNIEEQKNAENELRKLANYDPLTGLPNRALLLDRISHALDNALRNQRKIALFFIDLDRFKQINDSLGHDVGDMLLTNVARVLQFCTRKSDTVARLGGDEFVIMLEDIDNIESISRIAQAILDKMAQPFQLGVHEVSASPSIGIAIYPNDGESSDDLMKHADIAMYHAKDSGRNNFKFFTNELNESAQTRLRLENELRTAIRDEEFILHYQPKISLQDNKIIGFECLARWQKSDGSLIPPFEFIPIAEELGLIIKITEQLIEQALQTLRDWRAEGIETCFALNLSARHLRHYDLTRFVAEQLASYQIPAAALEFELTESAIMEDMVKAVELLNNLHEQGIAISLDDFGTGYTSFQYLKDFPINALKIDRSFVKDIGHDQKDESIIEAIIALANNLDILAIAEGVETQAQADYLKDKGCPCAQGYLYSKPVGVAEALKLIRRENQKLLI